MAKVTDKEYPNSGLDLNIFEELTSLFKTENGTKSFCKISLPPLSEISDVSLIQKLHILFNLMIFSYR